MADIIIPTPLNPTAMTGVTTAGNLVNVLVNTDGSIVTTGGSGGGGTSIDRELVVETYRAINVATGVSIGDLITQSQVIDVTATPSTVSVLWRNQTTGADIAAPGFANLELAGGSTTAITNALGAVADAAATTDTGSFSVLAFLKRGMQNWTSLLAKLPALVSGRIPVDTSGVTSPISAASLPLPTGAATSAAQTTGNASLTNIDTDLGAQADAAATTDTGTFSLIALFKRLLSSTTTLSGKLPASLGIKTAAASLSTAPASDAIYPTVNLNVNPSVSFTRPADVVAYASGDTVANSTTAGSVAPLTLTAARTAAGTFMVHRLKLHKSGTSITNAAFRVHMFKAAPTSASGDNAAISMTGVANYLGYVDIVVDQAFTDGAAGFSSLAMSDTIVALASGQSLYALLEARAAYTPISAESFTLTCEITQD